MKLASLATLLAVVTTPVLAHAETSSNQAPRAEDNPSYRSEDTALMLSLGGTAASVAMLGLGLQLDNQQLATAGMLSSLVTPSLGHWYAGDMLTAGMGIRAVGVGVMMVGLVQSFGCWGEDSSCTDDDSAATLLGVGLAAYAAGTVYDIATSRSAAREHNASFQLTSIAPTAIQSGNGQVTMGMGIGGTF